MNTQELEAFRDRIMEEEFIDEYRREFRDIAAELATVRCVLREEHEASARVEREGEAVRESSSSSEIHDALRAFSGARNERLALAARFAREDGEG